MGVCFVLRAGALGEGWVLAPERHDPRRAVAAGASRRLDALASIVTENVTAASFAPGRRVLVLDTAHAWEGFVLSLHAPVAPGELGSAKRRLAPGDVIVSRLRPYLRQVAYVDDALFALDAGGNDVCASTEFFVLRGVGGFDAAALVPVLLSEPVQAALAAGQEGGHHPRFTRELLGSIRVPEAVVTEAAATAERVRAMAKGHRDALQGGRALVAAVERQMGEASAGG